MLEDDDTWLKSSVHAIIGLRVLTHDRLLFFRRHSGGVEPWGLVPDRVEDKALIDIPLTAVTGASRQEKWQQKNRIKISTNEDGYLFATGWEDLGPALREQLVQLGRSIRDDGPDRWVVE